MQIIFSPELTTLLISALPFIELRGALPLAVSYFHFSWPKAFVLSVAGNILAVLLVLFLVEKISDFLREHSRWWQRFFDWLFQRTRRKAKATIDKYGQWGLYILVAIPLPMTGGWTGALAAFLFGLEKKRAALIISAGIVTAGLIVSLLTLGGNNIVAGFRRIF